MTVGQLLAGISSVELTEWQAYFAWKADRAEEERQWQAELAKAQRYVNEGR